MLAAATLSASGPETPSAVLNQQLPKWVRFSFDHRFRFEDYRALRYNEGNDDHWLLNRFRVNLTLQATPWWSFQFQGQDARILFKEISSGTAPYTNRTDLRLAFTEFGNATKGRIALRVGRQELAYGEDRVLGAANWANVARSFDAVKLMLHQGPIQLDLFSAAAVVLKQDGLSHHIAGNNIHGAYLRWNEFFPGAILEPYFYWRVGTGRGDVPGGVGHMDRRIAAIRYIAKLPSNFDCSTEFVHESGSLGNTSVRAFAMHLLAAHTFVKTKWKPRWLGEYNYASGDRVPGDGRSGTFDQTYPTAHEKTGLADQVGWQNISHLSTGLELSPWRKLILRAKVHDWHLAQARDGIYLTNGNLMYRDPTGRTGTHVGEEIDTTATYTVGPHIVGVGVGHLFPGDFLRHFSQGKSLNYFYLNVGYRF